MVTAAGTTTLDVDSHYIQLFTGTTTQNVVLSVAATLQAGWSVIINNQSTGIVTVKTSGGNIIQAMIGVPSSAYNSVLTLTCINPSGGTGTASWIWEYKATGYFTLTGTGFAGTVSVTCFFSLINKRAFLTMYGFWGTSNSVTFGLTGLPPILWPSIQQQCPVSFLEDNSASVASPGLAMIYVAPGYNNNNIAFSLNGHADYWTASGEKGIPISFTLSYLLSF
jgi:hypothetical protein